MTNNQTNNEYMKKISSLSAALLLAVGTVVGMTGCAGDRYHQSTGEHIDDAATTERVNSALSGDAMYKYPGVKVVTFKGTVQLSGFVDTRDQKSRADKLAKGVEGVKDVVDNITVKQ